MGGVPHSSRQFEGQTVRAVGKLVGIDGGSAQLELAGEGAYAPLLAVHALVLPRRRVAQAPGRRCFARAPRKRGTFTRPMG